MVWVFCGVLAWAGMPIDGVRNPRLSGGWISDHADVLDADMERSLNAYLQQLHEQTSVEIAVVTVPDSEDEPKAFATGLFNHWGIGNAQTNNGLLVLLVVDRRRLEMETGYGLEGTLSDGWLGGMQARTMVPLFKDGRYGDGLDAGLHEVGARVLANADAVRTGVRGQRPAEHNTQNAQWIAPAGVGGSLGLLGMGGFFFYRRRQSRCPHCKTQMPMLTEDEEDKHLAESQQHEEAIGSIDYNVHMCDTCDHGVILPRERWFTGYSRCPRCVTKSLKSVTRTLRSATYDHGGLVEVTDSCTYCTHKRSYQRSTPRRTRSSSSSSSGGYSGGGGGGSFGGGRSGGGGAGSSW